MNLRLGGVDFDEIPALGSEFGQLIRDADAAFRQSALHVEDDQRAALVHVGGEAGVLPPVHSVEPSSDSLTARAKSGGLTPYTEASSAAVSTEGSARFSWCRR